MHQRLFNAVLLAIAATGLASHGLAAEEVNVAVATNFLQPMRALEAAFEGATGHEVRVTSGSSGQLYAQIRNGAPLDVFLSADRQRPRLLAEASAADADSQFTYAMGQLVLWSREPIRVSETELRELSSASFRWLAIAEPEVAPYGTAARQVLENLGIWQTLRPRIVSGQNVAQAFAMAESRNAELGLVALSQAIAYSRPASYVQIPPELYDPIRQDAILLSRAAGNVAATAFFQFMQSAEAAAIIERYGYSVGTTAN